MKKNSFLTLILFALYFNNEIFAQQLHTIDIEKYEKSINNEGNYILIESQDSTEHRYIDCRNEAGVRDVVWAVSNYKDDLLPSEVWQQVGIDYYEINFSSKIIRSTADIPPSLLASILPI